MIHVEQFYPAPIHYTFEYQNTILQYWRSILFHYEIQMSLCCSVCDTNTVNNVNIWNNYRLLCRHKIHDKPNNALTDIVVKSLKDLLKKIDNDHICKIINLGIEKNWIYYDLDNLINPILLFDPFIEEFIYLTNLISKDESLKKEKSKQPMNDPKNPDEPMKDQEKSKESESKKSDEPIKDQEMKDPKQ